MEQPTLHEGILIATDGRRFRCLGRMAVETFQPGDLIGSYPGMYGPWLITVSRQVDLLWHLTYEACEGVTKIGHPFDSKDLMFTGNPKTKDTRWVPEPFIITEMELP